MKISLALFASLALQASAGRLKAYSKSRKNNELLPIDGLELCVSPTGALVFSKSTESAGYCRKLPKGARPGLVDDFFMFGKNYTGADQGESKYDRFSHPFTVVSVNEPTLPLSAGPISVDAEYNEKTDPFPILTQRPVGAGINTPLTANGVKQIPFWRAVTQGITGNYTNEYRISNPLIGEAKDENVLYACPFPPPPKNLIFEHYRLETNPKQDISKNIDPNSKQKHTPNRQTWLTTYTHAWSLHFGTKGDFEKAAYSKYYCNEVTLVGDLLDCMHKDERFAEVDTYGKKLWKAERSPCNAELRKPLTPEDREHAPPEPEDQEVNRRRSNAIIPPKKEGVKWSPEAFKRGYRQASN